jgi:hypothetical protein
MAGATEKVAAPVGSDRLNSYARLRSWAAERPVVRSGYGAVKHVGRPFYRTRLVPLLDRHELPILFNSCRLLGCGVEVGVQLGLFSESLLGSWHGKHLISVDPWRLAEADYQDPANVSQERHDSNHAETVQRLASFGERSTIWRMYGDEAAERIPHHSMDFVYLDARHDYGSVMSDLATWVDKVRPGGVICGHDYIDAVVSYGELGANHGEFGVKGAVDDFFAKREQKVKVTLLDYPWRSWYVML